MNRASGQVRNSSASRPVRKSSALLACLLACISVGRASAQSATTHPDSEAESLSLTTDAVSPRRFVAVHGRRALLDGYADSGLEVWAYPVQLIQGYRIGFRPEGTTTEIPGTTVLRRIVYRPSEIVRIYIGPNFIVREKLFVPLNDPAAILTYTVASGKPVDIVVHFTPVLNLMWPAGIGGQDVSWNSSASGYVLSEQTHRFSAVVGSTNIVAHDEIFNRAKSSVNQSALAFTVRPEGNTRHRTATVVIASGDNTARLNTFVKALTKTGGDLEEQDIAHYARLRSNMMQIETPDIALNKDLAWAEVALDQAWVCNPYLGCGFVAGYGPTRGARRPQYAWFFSGDGMVAARALLSAGEYARARDEIDFIAKYQDPKTGMIWHELSQSAGLIDWAGKYPYMFVHVDISFQYLNTIADYVAVSGDIKFLQSHWQSVQAAYRYCQSLIDPRDGLPRIPPGKEGGDEQDRMSDALTLSAQWVTASKSFAEMAAWMGDDSRSAQANDASRKARESLAKRYWDAKQDFWIDGYSPSGKEILNHSASGNIVILEHLFSKPREESLLNQLASPNFQADWGARSTPLNSSAYNPDSYAKGSVWAVGTANVALAFWTDHRPVTALPIWSGLIPWFSLDSLGHMDEVLAGDYYHEQTESVPEQTWSSAAFLRSTIQGLLGLQVDGIGRKIVFAPHLPANWNFVRVRNIHLPAAQLDFAWSRTDNGSELEIANSGAPVHLDYSPEIPLGAHLTGATWNGKPVPAKLEPHAQATDASLSIEVPHGASHLDLDYAGGISLVLPRAHPLLGDASHAMKVIGAKMRGAAYVVDAEVDPSRASTFQLRTKRKITAVHGATWKAVSPNIYTLTIEPSSSSNGASTYRPVEVLVDSLPSAR
ncbi:MAG: hypothetical protein WA708_15735 [Acidobacteriaceae bacterium]